MCNSCWVTIPIVTLPGFCLCCWNLHWIISWVSSCSSAVPSRPQGCVPCWGKSGAECSPAALPHQLPTLGLALSQPKSVLIHVHSKGQQLWQCVIRAQRWHVYRKSWPHQGNWNIIPGFIISTAMANVQMWNYMYGIINRLNYEKELNACWKQQREVKVSDMIVTRGPSTFCTYSVSFFHWVSSSATFQLQSK